MCYNIESLCHRRLDWWQKDYIFIFVTIYSYEPIKYYYLSVSFLFIYNFFFRNGSTTKFYGSIYLTLKIKDQVAILVLHSPGEENVFWIDIKSLQNTHSLSLSLIFFTLSLSFSLYGHRLEMASIFRDRSLGLGHSKRNSFSSATTATAANVSPSSATSSFAAPITSFPDALPCPFGDVTLSATDLRASAYEIFLASTRSSSSKPLTYTSNSLSNNNSISCGDGNSSLSNGNNSNNSSSSLQRSLTSTAASKMKKALGLRSSSKRGSDGGSPQSSGSGGKTKKPVTIGELMRVQMRVSDAMDSRIRRGLLRISAGQVDYLLLNFTRFPNLCDFF